MRTERGLWAKTLPALLQGGYIRAVNFHLTPACQADFFDRQLAYLSERFAPVSEDDLHAFFATKRWHKEKPGVILSFYNGYRNNYDVIAPLLARHGLIGWFFVATEFVDTPAEEQVAYAAAHTLVLAADEYPDGRHALSWQEVRELGRGHVIASHTKTHSRLTTGSTDEEMRREIIESKRELEAQLGREVSAFAWLGGEEYGCNEQASRYLDEAGYRYLFSNMKIQKISD